jgi:hypothetical protein
MGHRLRRADRHGGLQFRAHAERRQGRGPHLRHRHALAREKPWSYAYDRLVETMLGIGVAWTISLVPNLIQIDESERTGA